jgi:hypothetical protein
MKKHSCFLRMYEYFILIAHDWKILNDVLQSKRVWHCRSHNSIGIILSLLFWVCILIILCPHWEKKFNNQYTVIIWGCQADIQTHTAKKFPLIIFPEKELLGLTPTKLRLSHTVLCILSHLLCFASLVAIMNKKPKLRIILFKEVLGMTGEWSCTSPDRGPREENLIRALKTKEKVVFVRGGGKGER